MIGFNYKEFYKAFEKRFIEKNKTAISTLLFKPLFDPAELLDQNGTPYAIDNNNSSKWCGGRSPIPRNIREAVIQDVYKDDIVLYFNRDVVGRIESDLQQDMLDALISLINHSNLEITRRQQLNDLYAGNEIGDFLAYAFMSAVIGSDKSTKKQAPSIPHNGNPEEALSDFRKIIKEHYTKPESMPVPSEIDVEELKYVEALYEAYEQTSGITISNTDDLGNYTKHFNRQRKNYYLAETIHREIRDTIHHDEAGFNTFKDEIEEGVAEVSERVYSNPVQKIDSVMENAGMMPISHNTEDVMLGWVGPGEKKRSLPYACK